MFESFLALVLGCFLLSSFSGWILLFIAFCLVTAIEDYKHPIWALAFTFVVGALFLFANKFDLTWVSLHPWQTAGYVVGYFVVGALWMIKRFDDVCSEAVAQYTSIRNTFIKKNCHDGWDDSKPEANADERQSLMQSGKCIDKDMQRKWEQELTTQWEKNPYCQERCSEAFPTNYRQYYDALSCWFLYWPVDLLWTFIRDWVMDFARTVINKLRRVFDAISMRQARKVIPNIDKSDDMR